MTWLCRSAATIMIVAGANALGDGSAQAVIQRHNPGDAPHHHQAGGRQSGNAVYYGDTFQGRIMANGKPFDVNALTAASRTLPLGTRARVTNRHTGQSTIVIITDRGRLHHVIIDLTPRAARAIGLTVEKGIVPVLVQPVD